MNQLIKSSSLRPAVLRATSVSVLVGSLLFNVSPAFAQVPGEFTVGQAVQVREGDVWSKATVLKKEGRKFEVRYEGGDASTDEWVTTDRLRKVGETTAAPGIGVAGDKAPEPTAKKNVASRWKIGDDLEVKDTATWRKCRVMNMRGEWLLIEYEGWNGWREWVEPWRVRKMGDTTDNLPWAKSNGRWKTGDNPPRDKPGEAPSKEDRAAGRADPFSAPAVELPTTEADVSGNKDLVPTAPTGAWSVAVDPAVPGPSGKPTPLRAKSTDADLRLKRILLGKGSAVVCWTDLFGNRKVVVEQLDLITGSNSGVVELPAATLPFTASPSGKIIAGRSNGFHAGTKSRLDLFTLTTGATKPQHMVSFSPYAFKEKGESDVGWAVMLDETTLLTCNTGGDLVSWQVGAASVKASWTQPLGKGVLPWFAGENTGGLAVSPGGKYVAAVSALGLLMLDARSGEVLGAIREGPTSVTHAAFSPSGKTLVTLSGGLICSFEMTAGKAGREVGTLQQVSSITCPDDTVVLTQSGTLIDLRTGAMVWQYKGATDGSIGLQGKQTWYEIDGRLAPATLPHESARRALTSVNDDILLLKPGAKIALDINISAEEKQRQQIDAAIRKQLEAGGLVIDPASPIRLVARTEEGKTEARTYRKMGPGGGTTETVNVTEKITRIYIEFSGAKIWERQSVSTAGSMLQMNQGQSVQDAATTQYNVGFFENVRIPTILPKAQDPASVGSSQLLLGGPRDVR